MALILPVTVVPGLNLPGGYSRWPYVQPPSVMAQKAVIYSGAYSNNAPRGPYKGQGEIVLVCPI